MRRNLFLSILMLVFIVLLVAGVIYLNDPELFVKRVVNSGPADNVISIEYRVYKGEIVHSFESDGYVAVDQPGDHISAISVSYTANGDFELVRQVGDDFESGDVICRVSNSDKLVGFKGKVVDVIYSRSGKTWSADVLLLNYQNLYISASLSADAYDKVGLDTRVVVLINGAEYETHFLYIGYEIVDGSIPVKVALPCAALPGTECEVVFHPDVRHFGMYVSSSAVYEVGVSNFVYVRSEGDNARQVSVEVGQKFDVVEGGQTFEYIEIVSGLSEDDVLVVEQMNDG